MADDAAKTVAARFSDISDWFDFVNMGSDKAGAWVNLDTGVVRPCVMARLVPAIHAFTARPACKS